jgi:acetylornithine/succinyldiaminopimelate/putrescine aminotransferase
MGRTGKFCAHEWEGITPDVMSFAKALGGGLPLGACLATEKVADCFLPGNHATTFGANPIACAAGLAMVRGVSDRELLNHCLAMGEKLRQGLEGCKSRYDFVVEVRGQGLIWGMELDFEAKDLVKAAIAEGLLITLAGPQTLRFLPPLNTTAAEMEEALGIIDRVLSDVKKPKG